MNNQKRKNHAVIDSRYSINQEYCGESLPRYIARFCGDWLGKANTMTGAQLIAIRHHERLLS